MGFFAKILGKKAKTAQAEEHSQTAVAVKSTQNTVSELHNHDTGNQELGAVDADSQAELASTPLSPQSDLSGSVQKVEQLPDTPTPEQCDVESEIFAAGGKQALADAAVPVPPIEATESIDRDAFILELRAVEPTPGNWLKAALHGCEAVDDAFWRRLELLFESLQLPAGKGEDFIAELRRWIADMQFTKVDEFSSELQYRLALALGMENDAEEKKRFWTKLWNGLARTRALISGSLRSLFSGNGELDAAFWENLEEALLLSDVGYEPSMELVERVRTAARKTGAKTPAQAKELLQHELEQVLTSPPAIRVANPPEIVLMVGVNGAGKTTTIAKLAYRERLAGKKVLIAAGDTFRAAAVEQLEVWAKRVGADFYSKPSNGNTPADPAAVAYEAVGKALAENYDIVFFDTAGRLQTKTGLMEELGKIVRVLGKRHNGAPQRTILVLDATTGQNALSQAKLFSETSPVSEIVISKLDGTAKAGVAVGIAMQHKIPITFIGLGEKMEDLRPFDGSAFAKALLE